MTANEIMKSIKDNLNSVEQNLEQIQCEDAISRQAVLKIIDGWYDNNRDTENIEDLIILITYMSSVNPQEPKTGRWIFQKIIHGKRMWCSNCDSSFDLCCNQIKRYDETTKKEYLWSHCPWCGARMESEDKE